MRRLPLWSLLGLGMMLGCQTTVAEVAGPPSTARPPNPYGAIGCQPQLQQVQAVLPEATLRVHVEDMSGAAVAGARLSVLWSGDPTWEASPIAGCVDTTAYVTDAAGTLVLDHMKIGQVTAGLLSEAGVVATASVFLADGQTVDVTLVKP